LKQEGIDYISDDTDPSPEQDFDVRLSQPVDNESCLLLIFKRYTSGICSGGSDSAARKTKRELDFAFSIGDPQSSTSLRTAVYSIRHPSSAICETADLVRLLKRGWRSFILEQLSSLQVVLSGEISRRSPTRVRVTLYGTDDAISAAETLLVPAETEYVCYKGTRYTTKTNIYDLQRKDCMEPLVPLASAQGK
jgi:hypothetical protein